MGYQSLHLFRAIKQYFRNRISRIVAADVAEIRAELTKMRVDYQPSENKGKFIKHATISLSKKIETKLVNEINDALILLYERYDGKTFEITYHDDGWRPKEDQPPGKVVGDPLSEQWSRALRDEFDSYKDNRLLQLWNSAVGLPNSEIQHQILIGSTGWGPDLTRVETELLQRGDLLPSNDPTRLVIAEFLIANGRYEEGVTQVLKTDQNLFWVARYYLGGRACLALSRFLEASDNLQAAMFKKDFRRAFFLAGQAKRQSGSAGAAAILFNEAAGLSDYTWTDLTSLPANTSVQR